MDMLKKYFGIILLAVVLLWHLGFSTTLRPTFYTIYSLVFQFFRVVYDFTLGFLPFGSIYVLVLVGLFYGIKKMRLWKRPTAISGVVIQIVNTLGCIVFLFYVLWGFHYYRPAIEAEISLPDIEVDSSQVYGEFKEITELLSRQRNLLSLDTNALAFDIVWSEMEDEIRTSQEAFLSSIGTSVVGRVRVRKLLPKGILLRFSTAGIYFPFVMEGHMDGGLNQLQWPFTVAHEMAHGYGYTDEGTCNFIGFITCMKSDSEYIRYSALLSYWKYLFYAVKATNAAMATDAYKSLPHGTKNDFIAIRKDIDNYPDILPKLRDIVYDNYLKSHGVKSGLSSYSEIIQLVVKWGKSPFYEAYKD